MLFFIILLTYRPLSYFHKLTLKTVDRSRFSRSMLVDIAWKHVRVMYSFPTKNLWSFCFPIVLFDVTFPFIKSLLIPLNLFSLALSHHTPTQIKFLFCSLSIFFFTFSPRFPFNIYLFLPSLVFCMYYLVQYFQASCGILSWWRRRCTLFLCSPPHPRVCSLCVFLPLLALLCYSLGEIIFPCEHRWLLIPEISKEENVRF